ncbi:MAG: hypothetical protein KGQ59_11455, partial [Bdellovibrionales bacterium]|nr:hypothetical protein [Bdellovibrionales bacterium]
ERELHDQERDVELASNKLRSLMDQNYDSEELRLARMSARDSEARRDQLRAQLKDAKLQISLYEQRLTEAHDWNEEQARAELLQSYDEERRVLQQKYSGLRNELAVIQGQIEQRALRRNALSEEWSASEKRIEEMVENRSLLLRQMQDAEEKLPRSRHPS